MLQRTTWRRQVKQTEVLSEFALRLKVGGRAAAEGTEQRPGWLNALAPPPLALRGAPSAGAAFGCCTRALAPWQHMQDSSFFFRAALRPACPLPLAGPPAHPPLPRPCLAAQELRAALLTDEQPLPGCGSTWRAQLEVCIQGKGSYGLLAAAWEELRSTVRNWLEGRNKPAAVSAAALQAGAVRAVRAMQAALGGGAGGDADSALLQVPLESIVGHDSGAGLGAVRHAIELEQRILEKRLAGASSGISPAAPASSQQQPSEGGGAAADATPGQAPMLASAHGQSPLVSHFSSISAAWADSDFDSGASDRMDATSEGTDLDSDWDP